MPEGEPASTLAEALALAALGAFLAAVAFLAGVVFLALAMVRYGFMVGLNGGKDSRVDNLGQEENTLKRLASKLLPKGNDLLEEVRLHGAGLITESSAEVQPLLVEPMRELLGANAE